MEQTLSTNNQGIKTQIAQLEDAIRRKQKVVNTTLTRWGSYPSQNADEQWIKRARKQLFVLNAALKDPHGSKPASLPKLSDEHANKLNDSGYNLRDAYRVLNFGKSPTDYVRRTDGTSGTRIGAARQFSKILGFEPGDYMRPNSPALKLLGKYANGLDQNQGSMDEMLDYVEHQQGVTNWSKHQQEQALRNNPDLAQIGGLEHFGRNVVRGVFHPSAVIREEIGGDRRTADQITQGEKVTNYAADLALNWALTHGMGGGGQAARVGTEVATHAGLGAVGKAALKQAAVNAISLAPETVINARKQQNLSGVPLGDALRNSVRDTVGSVATTKYIDPRSDVQWGDRTIGLMQQLGLLHGTAIAGRKFYDSRFASGQGSDGPIPHTNAPPIQNPKAPSVPGGKSAATLPSKPVVVLRGDEFGAGLSHGQIRDAVRKYAKVNFAGRKLSTPGLSNEVRIVSVDPGTGIEHSRNATRSADAYLAISRLPDLLGGATYLHSELDAKGRPYLWHYMTAPVEVGGRRFNVYLHIREGIPPKNHGDFFYHLDE